MNIFSGVKGEGRGEMVQCPQDFHSLLTMWQKVGKKKARRDKEKWRRKEGTLQFLEVYEKWKFLLGKS